MNQEEELLIEAITVKKLEKAKKPLQKAISKAVGPNREKLNALLRDFESAVAEFKELESAKEDTTPKQYKAKQKHLVQKWANVIKKAKSDKIKTILKSVGIGVGVLAALIGASQLIDSYVAANPDAPDLLKHIDNAGDKVRNGARRVAENITDPPAGEGGRSARKTLHSLERASEKGEFEKSLSEKAKEKLSQKRDFESKKNFKKSTKINGEFWKQMSHDLEKRNKSSVYTEEVIAEGIAFGKLSKKIDSFIRRAHGAEEHMPNGGAALKFEKFVDYMEKVKEKAVALEEKYDSSNAENQAKMKEDYKRLKEDAKKHMKILKDGTGRWLWTATDDPRFTKVLKTIAVGFYTALGISLTVGLVRAANA